MNTVSVIIPTYNRARCIGRAVRSVLSQSYRDFEIIVIDDGSEDNTLEVLTPYLENLTIIRNKKNRGVSHARNCGIARACGRLIALLDSDDYWLPEKLDMQVDYMNSHPEAVACQTEEVWIRNGRRVNPRKSHKKMSGDIFIPSLRRCLVSPSAVIIRRSLLTSVGTFDEDLPACEDYDLWLRIGWKYPVELLNSALVVKEGGHRDQLSRRVGCLDKYRIYSLEKILRTAPLPKDYRDAVMKELRRKCRIYGNGCLKRGRTSEGKTYLGLAERILNEIEKTNR